VDHAGALTVSNWLKSQIESEAYWFHRMELPGGLVTPGWNDPKATKLPYFGLPDDMTGMRVLAEIYEIVREQRAISADVALHHGKYFGMTPQFWMNLQADYDLRRAAARAPLSRIKPRSAA